MKITAYVCKQNVNITRYALDVAILPGICPLIIGNMVLETP